MLMSQPAKGARRSVQLLVELKIVIDRLSVLSIVALLACIEAR